jgi:hypothetical protein
LAKRNGPNKKNVPKGPGPNGTF